MMRRNLIHLFSGIALTALLLFTGLLFTGCWGIEDFVDEEGEVTELPTRGYGTFKIEVDEIAPYAEQDEAGVYTGRVGQMYDQNNDGILDEFYQTFRASAGIVAMSFGADGYADAAIPVAMSFIEPGQTKYEIPLEPLTEWIVADRALGYRPGQYQDEPNTLVYLDRIYDREEEAILTGNHRNFDFWMANLGSVSVKPGKGYNEDYLEEDVPPENETYADDDDDDTPDYGVNNVRCGNDSSDGRKPTGWIGYCEKLYTCNHWNPDWTMDQCTDKMYTYINSSPGQRYWRCLDEINLQESCTQFLKQRKACWDEQFTDSYGCGSAWGPEARDLVMIVQNQANEIFKVNPGYILQAGEQLSVFVDYRDANGDLVAIDEETGALKLSSFNITGDVKDAPKFTMPEQLSSNSFDDKIMVGFTVASPVPKGEYQLVVRMVDAGCAREGVRFPIRFNSAGTGDVSVAPVNGSMSFEMYEVYSQEIDKFNIGKGFVDHRAIRGYSDYSFLYELEGWDVAIIQAYIWSFQSRDQFQLMNMDTLNSAIFTTTHDTHGTKFYEGDDVQAYAFFIDQPMSPGLFTFYGDEGWNLYPKAPYGDNEDQPFMRGDFESTTIKVPMAPIYTVNEKYTGCGDVCEYYLDKIYFDDTITVDPQALPTAFAGFANYDEALYNCRTNSADPFWMALINCYRKADDVSNACETLVECIQKNVTNNPSVTIPESLYSGSQVRICDQRPTIPLHFKLVIPTEYLANAEYLARLTDTRNPLQLGAFVQYGVGYGMVPGGWVPITTTQDGQIVTEYTLDLPYAPLVPDSFFGISATTSYKGTQLYLGLYDPKNDAMLGTGYYQPSDVYEDGEWLWLLMYTSNWTDPAQEGWCLGVVSGNTIYDFADPYTTPVVITFGDLRAVNEGILKP